MRENTYQKNSEHGHFSRSGRHSSFSVLKGKFCSHTLIFYKQQVYKQRALREQIAKQLLGLNP